MQKLRMVTAAVLVAGLSITAVAGLFSYRSYQRVEAQQSVLKTNSAASAVALALDRVALAVRAVKAMYAADWVTRDEFDRFARTLTASEGVRSLGFYRRVTDEGRAAYERDLAAVPGGDLGIWEFGPGGERVRAPQLPVYYVVESGYLLDGSTPAFGLDAASLPGRRETIDRAIASFELVVSPPLNFSGTSEAGVIFYIPAIDRSGSIVGVAAGTLTFDELSRVATLASGTPGIAVAVDVDPPEAALPRASLQAERPAIANKRVFSFGGRTWTVTVPPSGGEGTVAAWLVVLVVGLGLSTTAAVVAYMIGLARSTEVVRTRAQLRDMLDGLGPLAWLLTPQGIAVHVNRTAARAFGREEEDMVGRPLWDMPPPGSAPEQRDRLREAVGKAAAGADTRFDLTVVGEDDQERVLDVWVRPLGRGGAPVAYLVASAVDVTDRHEGEQTQRLLMRELDHRMKNTLQVIQAIIRRTARAQASVSSFERSLLGRVSAMSRAHDLLASERWLGAELGTVVRQEIASFEVGTPIRANGPPVRLSPRAALSIALAIHELGTNAAKYGALSAPEGKITIEWWVDRSAGEPNVTLHWQEAGGPPVKEPDSKGFGSMLIERSISYELEGRATLDYRTEGLVCTITIPMRMARPFVAERPELAAVEV